LTYYKDFYITKEEYEQMDFPSEGEYRNLNQGVFFKHERKNMVEITVPFPKEWGPTSAFDMIVASKTKNVRLRNINLFPKLGYGVSYCPDGTKHFISSMADNSATRNGDNMNLYNHFKHPNLDATGNFYTWND